MTLQLWGLTDMEIKLTQGQIALLDDADYELVSMYKWSAVKSNKYEYYATAFINGKSIRMHRYLLQATITDIVDHKNGNTLDNRRENIRLCTHQENQRNRHRTVGKSKYRGVTWTGNIKKWRARLTVDGRKIHLGYYTLEEEAAEAYDKKALAVFKEFASLNIK